LAKWHAAMWMRDRARAARVAETEVMDIVGVTTLVIDSTCKIANYSKQ